MWTATCDVTDYEAVWQTFDRFETEVGACDLLVNSAGIFLPAYFETMPMEWFAEHLDVDVLGIIYSCRAVVPRMSARGRGHIVNVSSMAGFMGFFGYTAYSTAKYAVMGFSESLRSGDEAARDRCHGRVPAGRRHTGARRRAFSPPGRDSSSVLGQSPGDSIPSAVAAELVRGVERNKYLVIPGFTNKLYYLLKGIWPGLFFMITDSDVKKARAGIEARAREAPTDV